MFFGVLETVPALTALFEKYADIPKGLDKDTLVPLCASPTEPFKSDLEYLRTCNAIFDVRHVYLDLCEKTRDLVNAPSPKEEDVKNLATARTRAEGYLELHRYGLDFVRQRLNAHEVAKTLKPRTVRLAQKVDLTEKETYAMAYIVLSYAQMLTSNYGRSYDFPLMAQACEMNVQEGLAFMSSSRVHVKEAVISPPEDDPIGYGFKVPFTTCCVLTGMRLSEEVLLKIDKTVLAEVLVEEGNEEYSMLSAGTAEERKLRRSFQSSDDIFGESKKDSDKEDSSDKEGSDKEESDEKEKGKEEDEAKDIFELMREEVLKEKESSPDVQTVTDGDSQKLQPYNTNISYLSDRIEWLSVLIRVKTMVQDSMSELNKDMEKEVQLREQKAKERMLRGKCEKRLTLTQESKWLPRLEKLAMHLQLHPFEKLVLLVLTANVLSPKISPDSSRYSSRVDNFTVGNLIGLFAEGFEQEIDFRKYFYKTATLVKEGLISIQEGFRNSELMNKDVELDRRMLDFIVGLDTEFSELVEGSHLYTPTVKLDRVVLPETQKDLIVDTVRNFEHFQKAKKRLGLDEVLTYGSGMVLLFYGKSGTGKTMMANAVANMLGKRILLINYPSLGYMGADQAIKYIFREAKLTDSIIFFDECESIFLSRDKAEGAVNLLLTELEMHNQLVIMATNRAFDLDEAMHRRITLAIEFRMPDPLLRKAIWKAHIPESIKLAEDVNFDELALKYELSGGFIKNTVLAALSSAVSRNPNDPIVTMDDLRAGSGNQLRGRLAMVEFDRRVVPMHGLDDIVVSPDVLTKLRRIVHMDKARQVLYSEWGYSEKGGNEQGITVLLHGPPGCGKTLAAEAIGFETGKPLKVVNTTELVSKWVGETGKNIEGLFSEAKSLDAILVFDDAEALFGARHQSQSSSTDRYANMDTSVLLYHMERFPGIAVVTTNLLQSLDQAFFRRFRFIVEFDMPKASQRALLWKRLLPPKAPLAQDVNFEQLGEKYKFSGGVIKNCCFKAAASAALRISKDERVIRMKDLVEAAEEENVLAPPDSNIYV